MNGEASEDSPTCPYYNDWGTVSIFGNPIALMESRENSMSSIHNSQLNTCSYKGDETGWVPVIPKKT